MPQNSMLFDPIIDMYVLYWYAFVNSHCTRVGNSSIWIAWSACVTSNYFQLSLNSKILKQRPNLTTYKLRHSIPIWISQCSVFIFQKFEYQDAWPFPAFYVQVGEPGIPAIPVELQSVSLGFPLIVSWKQVGRGPGQLIQNVVLLQLMNPPLI